MFGFLAQLLAWCYDVVPNYGVTIVLFTLIVMAVVTPFTVKGMRSMAEMARLQPEMKRLQDQYKNDRIKMNEEMQALFKEHKVNPLGGCLPTLLPLPIFFIIFRLLERLTSRHKALIFDPRRVLNGLPNPHYLSRHSTLYGHLVRDGGRMVSFGMDLGKSARDSHGSIGAAIPFYALIVIMTASQYVQQQQMNKRNPQAAQANPQMKLTMQIFPAFYAIISLNIPASVVLYLFVSGIFRMAQNTLSYRYDPKLALPPLAAGGTVIEATSKTVPPRPGGAGGALSKGAASPKGAAPVKGAKPSPGGKGSPPGRGAEPTPEAEANGSPPSEKAPAKGPGNGGPPKGVLNVRPSGSGRVTPRSGKPKRRGR